jgi:hypothetical protein
MFLSLTAPWSGIRHPRASCRFPIGHRCLHPHHRPRRSNRRSTGQIGTGRAVIQDGLKRFNIRHPPFRYATAGAGCAEVLTAMNEGGLIAAERMGMEPDLVCPARSTPTMRALRKGELWIINRMFMGNDCRRATPNGHGKPRYSGWGSSSGMQQMRSGSDLSRVRIEFRVDYVRRCVDFRAAGRQLMICARLLRLRWSQLCQALL